MEDSRRCACDKFSISRSTGYLNGANIQRGVLRSSTRCSSKVKRPFARSASWRSVNWPGFTIEQYSIITIMALLSLWLFYRFRCDVFTVVINPLLEIYAVIPRVSLLDVSQKQSPSANFAYCRKFVSQKRYIVIILTSLSIERCEASNLHILSNLLAVLIFKLTIIYQFYNDFFH